MTLVHKVLIAIPVLLNGGTEMHTFSLVEALVSQGYRVSVCCYYGHDDAVVVEFEEAGAEIILMGLNKSRGLLRLFIKLFHLFRKVRPDILHVQYIAPGFIPIVAAKLAGIEKVFATVHQPGRPYGLKAKILIRIAASLCDAFFCNSKSVEESWFGDSQVFDPQKTNSKRKHFTIYNGVDVARIERIGKEVDREKVKGLLGIRDKRVIGVVGRLRKEKGQGTLLESMKRVIKQFPDAVLVVIGDGPDRPGLEEMAKQLGIYNHVRWLGQKGHDEVFGFYSIMDVVVVPSLFEGFGLTAAEAMACRRPVIGSQVDGLSEVIIDNLTGYLVPVRDSGVITRRLVELLSNEENMETMGEAGFRRALENFGTERFVGSIKAAYKFYAD